MATLQRDHLTHGPHSLPRSLAHLRGPTDGTVALPLHLCWSGPIQFDVSEPAMRLLMYQIVITEGDCGDLEAFLDAGYLLTVWPKLRRLLNSRYTQPWEERFPALLDAAKAAEPALRKELSQARRAAKEGLPI